MSAPEHLRWLTAYTHYYTHLRGHQALNDCPPVGRLEDSIPLSVAMGFLPFAEPPLIPADQYHEQRRSDHSRSELLDGNGEYREVDVRDSRNGGNIHAEHPLDYRSNHSERDHKPETRHRVVGRTGSVA